MYSYLYDEFLEDKRYEREVGVIETRLTDLGIMGKVTRLALFRDPVAVVKNEIADGARTVVAVGDEGTLRRVLEAVLPNCRQSGESQVVVGFIPVVKGGVLGPLLGIDAGSSACDTLSARLVQEIDLGEVNGRPYLHAAAGTFHSPKLSLQQSEMIWSGWADFQIINLALSVGKFEIDPTDGALDFFASQLKRRWFRKEEYLTHLRAGSFLLTSDKKMTVILDSEESLTADQLIFQVLPGRLRLVTGKDRRF